MSLELTNGGLCCGLDDALEMFEVFVPDALSTGGEVDAEEYEKALNRFRYCAKRIVPIKPRFIKGKYGKKYDYYSCGACGFSLDVIYKFCPNCGREVDWRQKWN